MFEMSVAQPNWLDVGKGFVPTAELFTNPGMLYIAIGELRYFHLHLSTHLHCCSLSSHVLDVLIQVSKGCSKHLTA